MSLHERGRVLLLCERPVADPAIGAVAAELGCELVRARSLAQALAYAAPSSGMAGIDQRSDRGSAPGFALVLAGYAGDPEALFDGVRRLRALLPETPILVHGVPPAPPFALEAIYEAGALAVLHAPVSPAILRAKARFFLDAHTNAAERRRAQAALEETRARLEATIALAATAVWTLDLASGRVTADARMLELYGLGPEHGADAPMDAFLAAMHPDDVAPTTALLRDAIASGSPYAATFRLRTADGGWRWVLGRGRREDSHGRAVMRGVIVDATVQKQAEELLRASEERYRTLFDSLDIGVCVIEMLYDAGGRPCDYRFLEYNPAFAGQTGLGDVIGKTIRSLAPLHEQHWFDTYGRVAETGEAAHFVNEAAQLNRWYDVYAARVGPAGSRKVVVLFTDITQRRHAETTLRRLADDLAEQDRRKNEFLATLAHELRNPLAPIRNGLQLLRRAGADAAAVARVHDIMDRQLDQLVHLVDDLLDVARITRGQVALKPAWIDLGEVLAAAVDTSMPLIEAGRHRLDVRPPPEPLVLHADATRLTQVVSNLLNNAAKYTPRGGAIVLAAERDGDQVLIAVSDNGIGIPADALEDVFTMFTQVAQHHGQGVPGGLGIGLSLVRSLVELHGGTIAAASAGPNLGSVFTVRLPLAGPTPAPAPAGAPAHAQAAGLRVLVVDDNRDAAETLSALLGLMGHEAPVAGDGRQALRMLAGLRPQVVFLDIGMPGMSGYDVAQAIRRDPAWNDVRLVALTGWGGSADRARTAAAGFDEHLTKPATVAAIEAVLARVTAARPGAGPAPP
ncbi:ATP-binding protein [uncultured Massilia sp.]|uniref:hybrid sensor histidine kinase/response regulator n=1 Tax=uncultured Massilia sp. TaxID=169973 RepID=UPI0025FCE2DC|nr:ATP-binding protein [uncultured Massilia sp.]